MAEIQPPPPAYRIPATRPGAGAGQSSQAPRRKPEADHRHPDDRRRRGQRDDDDVHIDEYA